MRTPLMALAVLTFTLAACGSSNSDNPPAAPAPASAPSNTATAGNLLRIEPSTLPDCTPAQVVVSWSADETDAATDVNVRVENTDELFAEGGATGRSETGPWVRPGTTFVLEDRRSKKELARAVVEGPSCD